MALVCFTQSTVHTVREAHKPQSKFRGPAPQYKEAHGHSISPKEPVLQKKLWGSTEDVVQTTNFINTVRLDV